LIREYADEIKKLKDQLQQINLVPKKSFRSMKSSRKIPDTNGTTLGHSFTFSD